MGLPRLASAQKVTIDLMTGTAYNVPTLLTIHQDGYPDIRFNAHYDTKPFGPFAPYYSWRVDLWNKEKTAAWEVQLVHHRLFLTNTTVDVQEFNIHYGYIFFLVGRAWRMHGLVVHASGGVIVPSPSSQIRGQTFNAGSGPLDVGYHIRGAGAGVAASRTVKLGKYVYVVADGAVLGGRARVPIAGGKATVPNLGFHGHLGIGLSF